MSAFELAVLIGITAAFTTFAAVLAWVSRADGVPRSASSAVPAKADARTRNEGGFNKLGRASSV
jgi:hypothetical protein